MCVRSYGWQLAMFIWQNGEGFTLTEVDFLCGFVSNPESLKCAAWLAVNFPVCV
jgi:hypothetical protein